MKVFFRVIAVILIAIAIISAFVFKIQNWEMSQIALWLNYPIHVIAIILFLLSGLWLLYLSLD